MKVVLQALSLLLVADLSIAHAETLAIRTATDLTRIAIHEQKSGDDFILTCTVLTDTASNIWDFCVEDASGATILRQMRKAPDMDVRAGDVIRAKGKVLASPYGHVCAQCSEIQRLSHGNPPPIPTATGSDFNAGKYDCRPVQLAGTVVDAFLDDIDRLYTHLILNCDGKIIYAPCANFGATDRILGATVRVTGTVHPRTSGARRHIGRTLMIPDRNALSVICYSDDDLFKVPVLKTVEPSAPTEVQALGRRQASGTVMARWQQRNILIRTFDGPLVKCDIASQQIIPRVGQAIDVTGIVDTDLFQLTLCRATWRPSAAARSPAGEADAVATSSLIGEGTGIEIPDPALLGHSVRIRGIVRNLPTSDTETGILFIESDRHLIPIDISCNREASDGLSVGCLIEVTGICVFDTELWRQNAVFPRVRGYRIVTRTPQDVSVVRQPPWWTSGRLFAAIGLLLVLMAGVLAWNLTLRRLVESRGREIAAGRIAQAATAAKVQERTRLAVELHDSVAQNLTGVSLEIRAARRARDENSDLQDHHLNMAARTLDSCRDELRNCLWDLRNLALDETTVDEALRKTLLQHVGDKKLLLRFNVPRKKFSDDTIHTVLRIVRELVINAVQHGHADEIKVAGSIDGDKLLFSVRDNGRGFDPRTVPGIRDGHFGLQGIRDRIDTFNGDLSVDSAPGKGAKVVVTMQLPNVAQQYGTGEQDVG